MSVSPLMSTSPDTTQKTPYAPRDTGGSNDSSSGGTGSSADELLDSFMKLFVAQLQNQDPTNPMDNNQLTTQLAQINMTAGIEQLNKTVTAVGNVVLMGQQQAAADWVGRSVMIEGDPGVSTAENGNQRFGVALDSDADKVTVTLTDKEGNAYTAEVKDVKAGVHSYTLDDLQNWQPADPTTDKGPDGQGKDFKVSFSASNESGQTPNITALKWAKVNAVAVAGGVAQLQLGVDGTAMLSEIYMVE